ncbi:hypothetical protein U2083_14355, partial [Listeria monocytogenes]|uniref:hypothetical protein n=1 Tax=Listeria monocytogenes TaxID=1639 RepID=UPI002FDBFD30
MTRLQGFQNGHDFWGQPLRAVDGSHGPAPADAAATAPAAATDDAADRRHHAVAAGPVWRRRWWWREWGVWPGGRHA